MNNKTRNLIVFIGVMIAAISLELALHYSSIQDENVYLVFVLAILITIIETQNIYYGIFGSLILVLSFNYFITEPRFSFVMNDHNHYVSFAMFLIVTLLVNSLVLQLQKQMEISQENERRINCLYKLSHDFLQTRSYSEVYQKTVNDLTEYLGKEVGIITSEKDIYGKQPNEEFLNYLTELKEDDVVKELRHYFNKKNQFFAIGSSFREYGALIVEDGEHLSKEDSAFIENVIEEMLVVLDKNYIAAERENNLIQVENEKFKTSLLRGLSHDIRTPLTMIQSGSDFLLNSFDSIDDQSKRELISDIYNESCDLSSFVDNLLDMTRLDKEHVELSLSKEPIDDVLFNVSERIGRRAANKEVNFHNNDELLFVEADIPLLSQVLINLVDNALRHTRKDTAIDVYYQKLPEAILFKVEDNGGGIKEENLEGLFDDFYTIAKDQDRRRNHGLGLSICKAIVEAHGGTIRAYNNEKDGLTIEFTIPLTVEENG